MKQSEESFFNATLAKTIELIQIHSELKYGQKTNKMTAIECKDVNDFL